MEILVSIICTSYNHEKYLRQCLDGFVMQQTNFNYEIIIHDDASTDSSQEIIKEYCAKYPDLFVPILQTENQYSKGVKIGATFMYPKARGKYIAECEGDDYWIDTLKLQKQVDYMENHPDYSMCFHKAKVLVEGYPEKHDSLYDHLENKDYNAIEIFERWTIPTASVLYRSQFIKTVPSDNRFIYGDIVLFLSLAEQGKIHCIGDVMSVYRRHSSGIILSSNSSERYRKTQEHLFALKDHFPSLSNNIGAHIKKERYYEYHALFREKKYLSCLIKMVKYWLCR